MLGRDHVSISVASVLPFVIPLLFLNDGAGILYGISLIIAVTVGSLIPDADCGGKPKLYYDFEIVYNIMVPLQKMVIWIFSRSDVVQKLELEHKVNNRHRGIMHSPVGVIISSIILTLISVTIALLFLNGFDLILVFTIFGGLLIGQFLHLLEDSCTVTGINWKFPFGTKNLKGEIYTFPKEKGKKDIRPMLYEYSLLSITIVLVLGYAFDLLSFVYVTIYPIIALSLVLVWAVILFTSKTTYDFWYQDSKKVQKFKKAMKKLGD